MEALHAPRDIPPHYRASTDDRDLETQLYPQTTLAELLQLSQRWGGSAVNVSLGEFTLRVEPAGLEQDAKTSTDIHETRQSEIVGILPGHSSTLETVSRDRVRLLCVAAFMIGALATTIAAYVCEMLSLR